MVTRLPLWALPLFQKAALYSSRCSQFRHHSGTGAFRHIALNRAYMGRPRVATLGRRERLIAHGGDLATKRKG